MAQVNKEFLQIGDVINLEKGMEIYAEIPSKFIYINSSMSNKLSETKVKIGTVIKNTIDIADAKAKLETKIYDAFRFVCGAEPDLEMVRELIDSTLGVYQEEEFDTSIFAGEYLVVKTAMEGGSTGRDYYPNGHHVYCQKLQDGKFAPNGTAVNFYQSGSFTATITSEQIKPVRKLTPTFV